MRLTLSQLKKLPVETKSGIELGKVYDIVFEIEGQTVAQYMVRQTVVSDKYLISRGQVIKIDEKKMVVEDNIKKIPIDFGLINKDVEIDTSPVMTDQSF